MPIAHLGADIGTGRVVGDRPRGAFVRGFAAGSEWRALILSFIEIRSLFRRGRHSFLEASNAFLWGLTRNGQILHRFALCVLWCGFRTTARPAGGTSQGHSMNQLVGILRLSGKRISPNDLSRMPNRLLSLCAARDSAVLLPQGGFWQRENVSLPKIKVR